MRFSKLRKKLAGWGIEWDPRLGKGSHGCFVGLTRRTRIRRTYPIPRSQQKEISNIYLKPLRRAFELTAEDGISDQEFFSWLPFALPGLALASDVCLSARRAERGDCLSGVTRVAVYNCVTRRPGSERNYRAGTMGGLEIVAVVCPGGAGGHRIG